MELNGRLGHLNRRDLRRRGLPTHQARPPIKMHKRLYFYGGPLDGLVWEYPEVCLPNDWSDLDRGVIGASIDLVNPLEHPPRELTKLCRYRLAASSSLPDGANVALMMAFMATITVAANASLVGSDPSVLTCETRACPAPRGTGSP